MTTQKTLSIAAVLLIAGAALLFGQQRPTRFSSLLIKSIGDALSVPFEIDLVTGQTTNPITIKDASGNTIYGITRLGAVSASGALAPSGGLTQNTATPGCHFYAGDAEPSTSTTGTDTTPVNGTVWVSELFVPANCTATGISYLIGSVGGTDKVNVSLYNSAGVLLANSAVDSSVTVGTTATMQRVPFTSTYAVTGPAKYFIGVQINGTTSRLRTQAFGDVDVTSVAGTFNTLPALTPPTTFTASKGPIAMLYN